MPGHYRLKFVAFILCLPALAKTYSCPEWVTSTASSWLSQHPDKPGVQLTLSSPRCRLHCTTSLQSAAANYTNEPPLLALSPWRVASVTKPFTAVAALRLMEQGLLDLHAPIKNYLPNWASAYLTQEQGAANASQITTWMLLRHTSGLADHARDGRFRAQALANPTYRWTQQTILEWAATHLVPVGPPGQAFYYSDTGYTYLGLVIENVTGCGLAESVRRLAGLDGLHMPSTYWEILEPRPPKALPRAGQYYASIDVTRADPSFDLYGGGGLVSNSRDLTRFTRAVHAGRLLNETTMVLLYSTVPSAEFPGGYGCGWVNSTVAGQQSWSHEGFWGGWTYYVPSLDLVFSGTDNQNHEFPLTLINLLLEGVIQTQGCQRAP